MRHAHRHLLLLGALAGALAGCGGGLDCHFAACGGDPVGTWDVDGICADLSAIQQDIRDTCPSATVSVRVDASGTVTFAADQTYSSSLRIDVNGTVTLPAACFEGSQVTSCDQITSDSVSCSGQISSRCTCRLSQSDDNSATGTWSTSGSIITLDDGSPDDAMYCVDGDSMKMQLIPDQPDDPTQLIVLTRGSA